MISQEKIEGYKKTLERQKGDLVKELGGLEKPEDFGSDVDDPDSIEAEEAEELGNQLAIAQSLRDRVAEIDDALIAIQEGKYGVCTKCGGPISEKVLAVAPESRLCEHCKKD